MTGAPSDTRLTLTPRRRNLVRLGLLLYFIFQFCYVFVFPSWHDWFWSWRSYLHPPFSNWAMYAGGSTHESSIQVRVETSDGREQTLDFNDYFHYRLVRRPYVTFPERNEFLLDPKPNFRHEKLLDWMRAQYNRRHGDAPAVAAAVYRLEWDSAFQDRSQARKRVILRKEYPHRGDRT